MTIVVELKEYYNDDDELRLLTTCFAVRICQYGYWRRQRELIIGAAPIDKSANKKKKKISDLAWL